MEYWTNPTKTYIWPTTEDPIVESMHDKEHCLFYHPTFNHQLINYQHRFEDLCNWSNNRYKDFFTNKNNHNQIARIVKLNMWIADIKTQGIVKPMLICYDGKFTCATGESRLRTLECIPEVAHVTAFITTHQQHAHKFSHLEPVITFNQFAELCNAKVGQQFLFRFTDAQAPWGLDWYEYNSDQVRWVTPSEDYCVSAVRKYLKDHPDTVFNKEWFSKLVDWKNV